MITSLTEMLGLFQLYDQVYNIIYIMWQIVSDTMGRNYEVITFVLKWFYFKEA